MTEEELREKIKAITDGPALIVAAVHKVDDRTLKHKPDPKKWCALEILGHLADVEVLYGYRLRQMLADKDPVIAPVDQDDWARNLGYMEASKDELLEPYLAARRANLRLLRRLTAADLDKGAFHPEHKRKVTVAELIGMMAGHDSNHARQIMELRKSAAGA
ncbi:MAG: DinB family protein [Acidobacteria bacterium]|nr:DinB family protein [Acidobacteriota bacterium]